MKPLLVNTYDQTGGAARAAYRLLCALRQEHVAAKLLVRNKRNNNEYVFRAESEWFGWCKGYLDFLLLKLYPQRVTDTFSAASVWDVLQRWVNHLEPDLLHLHWVGDGFLKIESLKSLDLPLVWTMHDSWAFTGGCHLPADCKKYETNCGACPLLGSQAENDLSRRVWDRKRRNYPLENMTFISPSHWLAKQARASSLLNGCVVEIIPNGVDVSIYSSGDKVAARLACGLPEDRKIILFGAKNAFTDINKGIDLVWEVLGKLLAEQRKKCLLVIFGERQNDFELPVEIEFINYGAVDDETEVVNLYRSADILLMTSRQENLPNMITEAMSCGLPCVAFAVGGIPEQIIHRKNGCLVKPYDTDAMSLEIAWLLCSEGERSALGIMAREYAEKNYSLQMVAQQHIALYEKILNSTYAESMPFASI